MDLLHRDFIGHTFIWWQGVVEDNKDPLKLGRCKVRILGFHTEVLKDISLDNLPWAYPMQPITSAAISGIGTTPTGLVSGSWVIGFFRDGVSAQEPIIMGSIGGIPEQSTNCQKNVGFCDQRTQSQLENSPKDQFEKQEYPNDGSGAQLKNEKKGKAYPKEGSQGPHGADLHEPDTNRLAYKWCKEEQTIVGLIKKTAYEKLPTALTKDRPKTVKDQLPAVGGNSRTESRDGPVWDERKSDYAPVYPYNHVKQSESGHTWEVDDTPDKERILEYHRSGTHYEVFPDGSKVERIVRDNYTVILKDQHIHIDGETVVTLDKSFRILQNTDKESGKNFDIQIGENANVNLEVMKGNVNITLHDGNFNGYVNGNYTLDVTGNMTERIGGKRFSYSGKDTEMKTMKSFLVNADKNIIEKCKGFREMKTGKYSVWNSGTYQRFVSKANTIIRGSTIQLN